MAIERQKKAEELLNKRKILATKQAIHRKANGSTLRFYDLKTELSDLNSEIVSFDISNLENQKKLSDKLMVFQMRRSERLLTIDEKLDTLQMEIIQKENELSLLSEKKQKSLIRSPIDGTVLEMTEGLSVGTFVQEGSSLFVLKKEGASQEVSAKFDTKYRHFLNVGRDVKLKINSPGFNKVFSGRISELSSDSLAYEEQNQSGKRYYRVTIEPDQEFVDLSLNLGMDVQVFVIDDEVSVFGFILSVLPSDIRFDVW
ncbi:hypothetical protein CS022_14720 [Veronia nyctiphanis]|uniref:AprE-like beta-barrel domain-containing protein n=1 Tax=Veronia nyctiphanis TaxID=1278244 RepID=A0A4Q0YNN5_9GAMM|nr:HlyD family efflux transporter periplasmic adaptor subunit [Veronia nyctiphanis]RXJ72562.1 hypothetical protein CS022_14720 [Veronia nyctiphanis]